MTVKEQAIKAIETLPDDADFQQIMDEVAFVAGVKKGLDELDQGKGIPIDEVREQVGSWVSR